MNYRQLDKKYSRQTFYVFSYYPTSFSTSKFDRGLSRLLHVDLHWLDVPERV